MVSRTKIAVALGTNLEPRLEYLERAALALGDDLLEGAQASQVYETTPWGHADQGRFYNAVIVGETDWKPPALVGYLKTLERDLGRKETFRNGPREIDLDLLIFGDTTWESEGVRVPHPGLAEREFVLVPLAEIWPDWLHPLAGQTCAELLARIRETQPRDAKPIAARLLSTTNP